MCSAPTSLKHFNAMQHKSSLYQQSTWQAVRQPSAARAGPRSSLCATLSWHTKGTKCQQHGQCLITRPQATRMQTTRPTSHGMCSANSRCRPSSRVSRLQLHRVKSRCSGRCVPSHCILSVQGPWDRRARSCLRYKPDRSAPHACDPSMHDQAGATLQQRL